jgi:hypothetical protein
MVGSGPIKETKDQFKYVDDHPEAIKSISSIVTETISEPDSFVARFLSFPPG